MKLLSSPASPFGRKVKILALETGLYDRLEIANVATSPVDPSAAVQDANPLAKIPCLVLEDGTAVYDSRVICEFLDGLHEKEPYVPRGGNERIEVLVRQALCDGLLDAALAVRYETLLRPEELRWQGWVDGQKTKIVRALDRLEAEAATLTSLRELGSICAACALGYLDFRFTQDDWRASRPKLEAWYDEVKRRPSMVKTSPA